LEWLGLFGAGNAAIRSTGNATADSASGSDTDAHSWRYSNTNSRPNSNPSAGIGKRNYNHSRIGFDYRL